MSFVASTITNNLANNGEGGGVAVNTNCYLFVGLSRCVCVCVCVCVLLFLIVIVVVHRFLSFFFHGCRIGYVHTDTTTLAMHTLYVHIQIQ